MEKRISILKTPVAASVPAANKRVSPGKNGVTTIPVSRNIIKNNNMYVSAEYSLAIVCRYLSRCRIMSANWRSMVQLSSNCQVRIELGGGSGIRTHETLAGLIVFKTIAINRSAIPPLQEFSRLYVDFVGLFLYI